MKEKSTEQPAAENYIRYHSHCDLVCGDVGQRSDRDQNLP